MSKIQKVAMIVGGIIITVSIAYVLGIQAGSYLNDQKRAEIREKGVKRTQMVLEYMETVAVGDTLTNFVLEDIDGNLHMLSEIVTNRSIVSFIKPDCEGCLLEIEAVSKLVPDSSDQRRFIFISSANPMHLQELRDNFGIHCHILYDEGRDAARSLKVDSYPFNIIINKSRKILEVYAGGMPSEVYERIVLASRAGSL